MLDIDENDESCVKILSCLLCKGRELVEVYNFAEAVRVLDERRTILECLESEDDRPIKRLISDLRKGKLYHLVEQLYKFYM